MHAVILRFELGLSQAIGAAQESRVPQALPQSGLQAGPAVARFDQLNIGTTGILTYKALWVQEFNTNGI
jgi:hypothetical protein